MLQILLLASVVLGAQPYENGVPGGEPVFATGQIAPEKGPFPFSHASSLAQLPDGRLLCAWYAGTAEMAPDVAVYGSWLEPGATSWTEPKVLADTPGQSEGNPVLFLDANGVLWLFYGTIYGQEDPNKPGWAWATCKVKAIASDDGGRTWSQERILIDELGYLTRNKPITLRDGAIVLPINDVRNWTSMMLISKDGGNTWERSEVIDSGGGFSKGNIQPALVEREDGSILCLMRDGSDGHRVWKSVSTDGGFHWTKPVRAEIPNPNSALDLVRLDSGNILMVLNPVPAGRQQLSAWISRDGGNSWLIFRDIENGEGYAFYPAVIKGANGLLHVSYSRPDGGIRYATFNERWAWDDALLGAPVKLANVVAPIDMPDDELEEDLGLLNRSKDRALPLKDVPVEEHVRAQVNGLPEGTAHRLAFDGGHLLAFTEKQAYRLNEDGTWAPDPAVAAFEGALPEGAGAVLAWTRLRNTAWVGAENGLYRVGPDGQAQRHATYGTNGPLDSRITALAVDPQGEMYVGTPRGLSVLRPDGSWAHITGRQGLPCEDVTSLSIAPNGDLWIGTSIGAALYRPHAEGRRWYYRFGERYLPGNRVHSVAVAPDAKSVSFATDKGIGRIDLIQRTLLERAEIIEDLVNKRHRRLGMVASCVLDDALNPTSHTIDDNDNDGLWTAYHVAAMSLAYGATGDERYKQSAKESMHSLYMLQNASGVPGLVARTVLPPELGKKRNEELAQERAKKGRPPFEQWRPTPDGTMYWKSDTSSDEIDGHYMAFYAYYRHVAQFDPEERELIRKQVTDLTNYIVNNNYQLIDWTGKRTTWGFWNPENINDDPVHFLENGLNSLQILSFLKTAQFITGNPKYKEHFRKLAVDHHYLSNLLLSKKVFPDEHNHSDDQLGFVAWYPILQLEQDPAVRSALHSGVRRHYLVIEPKRPSFFMFAHGTIDPDHTDMKSALLTLQEIPTDRRQWLQEHGHRTDVVFDPRLDRFGEKQLLQILPADEYCFGKWNRNPYLVKEGGPGVNEDDGAAYLLPYWMGRYHGFIAAPE